VFFFEKKNQKTFANWAEHTPGTAEPNKQKSFASLFSKKKCFVPPGIQEQGPEFKRHCNTLPSRSPVTEGTADRVRDRPVRGARAIYRVQTRHGVSRLKNGVRCTRDMIFHDAG
jgi:hypothetical protein